MVVAFAAAATDPTEQVRMHLLAGIARCGVCGAVVQVNTRRARVTYYCADFHVSRGQRDVDAAVESVVFERLTVATTPAVPFSPSPRVSRVDDIVGAHTTSRELFCVAPGEPDRLEAVLHGAVLRTFAPPPRTDRSRHRSPGQDSSRTNDARRRTGPQTFAATDVIDARRWGALPMQTRRDLLRALVDITILPVGRGRRSFRSESVRVRWRS